MKSMVVLFAVCAVACGSLVPLAQPPHHPAIVLDAHGRPLDTAEVIGARALHLQAKALEGHYAPLAHVAHAAVVAPVHAALIAPAHAVSHQARYDVSHSPALVSHAYAAPLLAHSYGHGHLLKKRSLGHYAYSAPIVAPSAVSHQSRVDVISSPAVSHSIAAPVAYAAAPVVTHAAPVVAIAPSAVSHQSRVDVRTSPAVVSHSVIAPVAHSVYAAPLTYAAPLAHSYANSYGHAHLLKKRSLAHYAYSAPIVAPSAVSHQSRIDVISSPAVVSHTVSAPVYAHAAPVYSHAAPVIAVAPSAVSHQSRVDVRTSPAVVSHSVVAAPAYSVYNSHAALGHYLKKRSVAAVYAPVAHVLPSAVSHQSRVDIISKPAVVSQVVAPVVHAARYVTPLAHSAVWTAPAAHLSYSGLLHNTAVAHW